MTTFSLAFTLLCQRPGLDIGYILVRRAYEVPDGIQRLVEGKARQGCIYPPGQALSRLNQATVNLLQRAGSRHDTRVIATNHADDAIEQVAELIGKIAIISVNEAFQGKIAIFG